MAATLGFPKWLLNCKNEITHSEEWNNFVKQLHEAIQQYLTESHVQHFTDLSESEKKLFMKRATLAVEKSLQNILPLYASPFQSLYNDVSSSLDHHLNREVFRCLLDDNTIMDTKTDLIIEHAQDGVASLLKYWPEMRFKLNIFFNQPLPMPLRHLIWKLFLQNAPAQRRYVDILMGNPRFAISSYDLEISNKCESLLSSEPTLTDIKGSVGAFYGMKAVLSYYHTVSQSPDPLTDADYLLVTPFIHVLLPYISRHEPASERIVVLMVEEFLTFMDRRPGFIVDSKNSGAELKTFMKRVIYILETKYPDAAGSIKNTFFYTQEQTVAHETISESDHKVFYTLMKSLIQNLFAGYFNVDTMLYVWDQYILGMDTPGFFTEWLATVTVIVLFLLKDKMKACQSISAMEAMLHSECAKLMLSELQYQVKAHFYQELLSMLSQDQKAAVPVLDPTHACYPQWHKWFDEDMLPYTRPLNRRLARENREAERERLAQQLVDNEKQIRSDGERAMKAAVEQQMKLVTEERKKVKNENMELENLLAQEKEQRQKVERWADDEILKLREEIALLKTQMRKCSQSSAYSINSTISQVLIPPPPTPASLLSKQLPTTFTSAGNGKIKAESILMDLLGKVGCTINKIVHGEKGEVEQLNKHSKICLQNYVEDMIKAERKIFGHRVKLNEWHKLTAKEKAERKRKLINEIEQQRRNRDVSK